MEKYFFVKNINNTNETGIMDVDSNKLLCLCAEENSKIILDALNNHNDAIKKIEELENQIGGLCEELNDLYFQYELD